MDDNHESNRVSSDWPAISILICSRDRRDLLDQVVEGVRSQGYPGTYEIVIVEETDDPRPIPGTRYHSIPVRDLGFGYTRNVSLSLARHEILVFIDDDAQPVENWLEYLVGHFSDPGIQGVAGAVALPPSNITGGAEYILGFPGGGLKYLHWSGGKPGPTRAISTVNAAYRKQAVTSAGGFDDRAVYGGEDQRLADTICSSGSCVFDPRAQVLHYPRGSLRRIASWFRRRGRAAIIPEPTTGWWPLVRAFYFPKPLLFAAGGWLISGLTGAVTGLLLFLAVSSFLVLWSYRFALDYPHIHTASWFMTVPVKQVMAINYDIGVLTGLLQRIFRGGE